MIKRNKTFLLIIVVLIVILFLNSCGPPQAEIDATTTKAAAALFSTQTAEAPTSMPTSTNTPTPNPPTASPTSIPPTAPPTPTVEPLPGLVPEGIVITFTKKEECTVSGPTELPAGEYTYVLRDLSGVRHTIYISYLLDGKTYQDLVDMQGKPGRYWPKPDWVVYAKITDGWRNESRNELYLTFSLEEGEHAAVYLGSTQPVSLWFCAPIWVK